MIDTEIPVYDFPYWANDGHITCQSYNSYIGYQFITEYSTRTLGTLMHHIYNCTAPEPENG